MRSKNNYYRQPLLYHCTMVQWYTSIFHNTIIHNLKNNIHCKSAIYRSFHVISDTLLSLKSIKNRIFRPKNTSKNNVFASFFIKNAPKTRYFHQKNDLKTPIFGIKWSKVTCPNIG